MNAVDVSSISIWNAQVMKSDAQTSVPTEELPMPRDTQNKLLARRGLRLPVMTGIVALVFAACGGSSDPAGDVSSASAEGDAIVVVADDTKFEPHALDASPGEEVTVEVRNEDDIAHDFAIEEFDLNTGTIEPGDVATATFEVPEKEIEFVCTFHSEMKGTIAPREPTTQS